MMRQMIGVGATVGVLVFAAHFALYLTAARSEDRFTEYFNGAPDSPGPWSPANWDVIVHARSDDNTNTMHADHDAACGAPPGTHLITSLSEAVFLCRDHLMTAVNSSSSGYAVAYITPAAMTDWSDSPATISFDVSTARSTKRDWIDLWLTPWDQNMVLPLDPWLPDLNGPPDKALHFRLGNKFGWEIYQWPGEVKLSRNDWQNLPVPYSRLQRDSFTIKIGGGQIEMSYRNNATGMVRIFEKVPLPANLGFDRAVVQIGHHSYTPDKQCEFGQIGSCGPNTWHWDNVSISPAIPFSMAKMGNASSAVTLRVGPGWLRFAARGATELSWGSGWQRVLPVNHVAIDNNGHFASYFVPIPEGADSVQIRGTATWAGQWSAKDIAVWNIEKSKTR